MATDNETLEIGLWISERRYSKNLLTLCVYEILL